MSAPFLLALCVCLALGGIVAISATEKESWPSAGNYAEWADIPLRPPDPAAGPDASTGSFTQECGRNERGHRNADNPVISPGLVGGAHHTHDYVGNVSTDAHSTARSLAAAATTCLGGDRSAYYWPVLRRLDQEGADAHDHGGGKDGNTGRILIPSSVTIAFLGSPVSEVIPLPRSLRMITGDPVAATSDSGRARARWGCTDRPDRHTEKYPLCPSGSGPTRTLDFPSCWNGLHPDSADHRSHIVFPGAGGLCPPATFPVPRLRITIAYAPPPAAPFALDSFPEQRRHPSTDHAMFINVMTDQRLARMARCLNEGRRCRAE